MGFLLAPTAEAAGYRFEAFDTIGSTNAVAIERAKDGDPGRVWFVSKRQEAGRDVAAGSGRRRKATLPRPCCWCPISS